MKYYFLLILTFFIFAKGYSQNPDNYLLSLRDELMLNKNNPQYLKSVIEREEEKFEDNDKDFFHIGSLYADLFLKSLNQKDEEIITSVNQLLRINSSKYKLIDVDCYYNLSQKYYPYSHKLAMAYIDKAIQICEKMPIKIILANLYSSKAGLYYADKDYANAQKYYELSFAEFLRSKDLLYASSQYNNIAIIKSLQQKTGEAVKLTEKAISILSSKMTLTNEEENFLFEMKSNLGKYYYDIRNYKTSENLLQESLDYYIKVNDLQRIIENYQKIFLVFSKTNEHEKIKKIIKNIELIENKVTTTKSKIQNDEVLLNYYAGINDIEKSKYYSEKIVVLNQDLVKESEERIIQLSDIAHKSIIENINLKENLEIQNIKKKNNWYASLIILLLSTIAFSIEFYLFKKKKNSEIRKLNEEARDASEKLIEQQVKNQEEKIKNLHLKLNIKKETEIAVLEKIKKVRKTNTSDTEKILRELFVDMKNIASIDKKNFDFEIETDNDGKCFKKALSEKFPNLTEQELQLCTYFRLELSAKEISLLEKISDGSVRVYKSKIKNKMGLSKEIRIEDFLKNEI